MDYSIITDIGDFNLSHTTWPEGESTSENEKAFLDLFNDLGLDQVINGPACMRRARSLTCS